MSIRQNQRLLSTVGSLLICSMISLGCAQEQPPELPPVESMSADVSAMEAAPFAARNANPDGTGEYSNFANAWLRVNLLRLYAAGVMFVPAVAMGLALTQEAEADGEDWVWTVTVGQTTARLEVALGLVSGWDVDFLISNPEE